MTLTLLTPGAQSSTGWRGDFETGNFKQWVYGVQQKVGGRATIVSSPLREGRYAARFEVRPGDNNVAGSGNGERTEALIDQATTGGYEGREQWWAWSTYFDPSFTSNTSGWNDFTQFHHTGPTGQANVAWAAAANTLKMKVCNGSDASSPTCKWWTLDSNRRNGVWYDFVFHVKWSSNGSDGLVELWENGKKVLPLTHMATLYPGEGVYLKQGYYRVAQDNVAVVYDDGMRRGDSYQDVVADFPSGTWPASPDGTITLPRPSISGSPVVGATLKAAVDTSALTSSVASTLALTWRRCDASGSSCKDISGATGSGYTVAALDAGSTLRVVASVETAGDTVASTSDATAVVAPSSVVLPLPSILGTASVGSDLTAALDASKLSLDLLSLAYQWQSCNSTGGSCTDIDGSDSRSYTVASADVGSTLRVRVSAKTAAGLLTSTSPHTDVVEAPAPADLRTGFAVSSSLDDGQTLSGRLKWTASVSGGSASRVEFYVDGARAWTENLLPYVFNGDDGVLDSSTLEDGSHLLTVKAFTSDGSSVSTSAKVVVANKTPAASVSVSSSIADGQTLSGRVPWTVSVGGGTASRVDYYIDGSLKWTENLLPYVFNGDGGTLDTTGLSNGGHSFAVRVYADGGSVVTASATATVDNRTASTPPPPPATTEPVGVSTNVSDNQQLSGRFGWTASVTGAVDRVEFYVDGSLESTENLVPYVFGGDDGNLDTTRMRNGRHTLVVKAVGKDGSTATASVAVRFKN